MSLIMGGWKVLSQNREDDFFYLLHGCSLLILGHCLEDALSNPVLITVFLVLTRMQRKGHWELNNEVIGS